MKIQITANNFLLRLREFSGTIMCNSDFMFEVSGDVVLNGNKLSISSLVLCGIIFKDSVKIMNFSGKSITILNCVFIDEINFGNNSLTSINLFQIIIRDFKNKGLRVYGGGYASTDNLALSRKLHLSGITTLYCPFMKSGLISKGNSMALSE